MQILRWTWTSIVFADVAAYFIGKNFGKTKLGSISSAAGGRYYYYYYWEKI
jgi:hypothetical protein